MRIARALSLLGYCSRREAEGLIAGGRVAVDGATVTTPATLVDPAAATVTVDGQTLAPQATRVYLALHKPPGVVSTVRDPHASRTVLDLVSSQGRLYPVGRLDKDSEGLILLTNDGELANLVTHPRYQVEKEYLALVKEPPSLETIQRLRSGVSVDGRRSAPARVEVARRSPEGVWVRLVLREGWNREVHRILAAVGHPVVRLVRVRIGPVRLGRLAPSASRPLTGAEVQRLQRTAPVRR